MSYIYVASPDSSPDPLVREQRYLAASHFVALRLQERIHVYSPIVHCHELAKIWNLPSTFEFWADYNMTMLKHALQLWVLRLEGWEESTGVKFEIEEARRRGIAISYPAIF